MPAARSSSRDLPADGAGADDQGARAGDAAGLAVPPLRVGAGGRGSRGSSLAWASTGAEHELRDRPVEDPARIGDHDVGGAQPVEEQRVDAGGSDVDPLQTVAVSARRPPPPSRRSPRGTTPARPRRRRPGPRRRRTATRVRPCQGLEVRRPLIRPLAEHDDDRRGRGRGTQSSARNTDCLIVNNLVAMARWTSADVLGPCPRPRRLRGQAWDWGRHPVRLRPRPRAVAVGARRRQPAPDPHGLLALPVTVEQAESRR